MSGAHVVSFVTAVTLFAISIKRPEPPALPAPRNRWNAPELPSMELNPDSYRDDTGKAHA